MEKENLFQPFPLGKFCLVQHYGVPTPVSWWEIREIMRSHEVMETCASILWAE